MIEIVTGQQAREVSRLDFCYMCGHPFTESNPSTRDHVPPKKIFLTKDRDWPLILPAHEECNSEYSFSDEQAKGLLALLHPTDTGNPPLRTKLIGIVKRGDKPAGVLLEGLSLGTIVSKILRACHAALYREYVLSEIKGPGAAKILIQALGNPNIFVRTRVACLSCTREDLMATSNKIIILRLPKRGWVEYLRVGFNETSARKYRTQVNDQTLAILLRDFGDSPEMRIVGTFPLLLRVSHANAMYQTSLCKLFVRASCRKCSAFSTVSEDELFSHVDSLHLSEFFRSLTYEEFRVLGLGRKAEKTDCD